MIPRHQTILFAVLLVASLVMGVVLWQLRDRAHQRLVAGENSVPTQAPEVAANEQATLLVANDADGSLLEQTHSLPLSKDPGSRVRAILGKLLDLYAAPNAAHAVPGGANSISQVFLMPVLSGGGTAQPNSPLSGTPAKAPQQSTEVDPDGPQLAVVNLTGGFVASHPSGLETETLTVLSICGTIHANLPRVTQVRFLVDGQPHATLAGHADLTRTYLTTDAVPVQGTQP
jgi:hypothetical protein